MKYTYNETHITCTYCLNASHYEGKRPSIPILKTKCEICIDEALIKKTVKANWRKKYKFLKKKTESDGQAKKRQRANEQVSRTYAKRLIALQNIGWTDPKEVPDEVADLKLAMLELVRAADSRGRKPKIKKEKTDEGNVKQSHLNWGSWSAAQK